MSSEYSPEFLEGLEGKIFQYIRMNRIKKPGCFDYDGFAKYVEGTPLENVTSPVCLEMVRKVLPK